MKFSPLRDKVDLKVYGNIGRNKANKEHFRNGF